MPPFRDEAHAALLRAARLEDENADLRAKLQQLERAARALEQNPEAARLRHMERVQRWLAVTVTMVLMASGPLVATRLFADKTAPRPSFGLHERRWAVLMSSDGALPFKSTTCLLDIVAVSTWPTASGRLNCHATLVCGDTTVFGGGNSGYEDCRLSTGDRPVSFEDRHVTLRDGDPAFEVDLARKTAVLHDDEPRSGQGYTAHFALE